MANDKRFAVKNGLQTQNVNFTSPSEAFSIQVNMLDSDVLSVSGNSGQLFSIADTMTGVIFAVNDISGVPSIEVYDTGKIQLAQLFGNVLIGTSTDNTIDKLQVNGSISSTVLKSTVASGTAPLVVNSSSLVTNLNADLLDGFQTSSTDAPLTIPTRDSNSLIAASGLRITTNEAGYSPLNVLTWNSLDKTYDFPLLNGVTGQLFQEQFFYGRAVGNIANGDVVMFAGAQGDQALFTKADTTAVGFQPRWVIGIASQNILNNEWGYVTSFGKVRDLLVDYPAGTVLYLNPAVPGGLTNIEPTAPNKKIVVAAVLRQSTSPSSYNAILLVRPDFSYHLYDLHDVNVSSVSNNQILAWNTNRWTNTSMASVAGISSSFVGTTDTQTLTNKTLNSVVLNDGYTEDVFDVTGTAPTLSPTNGSIQTWTLIGNSTPTAGTWNSGQSITLMIDDGSAFTITWTSLAVTWKTDGGLAPTLNTSGFTAIALWKVGTVIYGARVGDA